MQTKSRFIETLETRSLLSATIASLNAEGTLLVVGTAERDGIIVRVDKLDSTKVDISANDHVTQFDRRAVKRIYLMGGAGNDVLVVDESNGVLGVPVGLAGGAGDDTLIGASGNDLLSGGLGNDLLRGGGGADSLIGERGDDQLFGDVGNDLLNGGGGADKLFGGRGNDLEHGGDGDDRVDGDDGADNLTGDGGNDRVDGGAGDDRLDGGAGNDQCFGGLGQDLFSSHDKNTEHADQNGVEMRLQIKLESKTSDDEGHGKDNVVTEHD